MELAPDGLERLYPPGSDIVQACFHILDLFIGQKFIRYISVEGIIRSIIKGRQHRQYLQYEEYSPFGQHPDQFIFGNTFPY